MSPEIDCRLIKKIAVESMSAEPSVRKILNGEVTRPVVRQRIVPVLERMGIPVPPVKDSTA